MKLYPPENRGKSFAEVDRLYIANTAKLRKEGLLKSTSEKDEEYFNIGCERILNLNK